VATPANTNQTWRFGVYEVDVRNAELRRGGTPVKMREQSFRILVHLLEHAGEIVTREELRRLLWPSDTFVDFDHSLNTAVMKLREVLGDSAEAPLYIETIPKRGYRFIAPVSPPVDLPSGAAKPDGDSASLPISETTGAQDPASAPAESPAHRRWIGRSAVVIALVLLVAVGLAAFLLAHHAPASRDENQVSSAMQIVPITTAPGDAIFPTVSPDEREIAFAWDGTERRRYDLYVQLVGSDMPLRLTYSKSGLVGYPAWSPDGREIAFTRCDDGKSDGGIYVVPALGGAERKLTTVGCVDTLPGPLAWLADGKGMLMIDHCSADGPFGVVLFSLATGGKECLTNSESPSSADSAYRFSLSPDGRTIAFTRRVSSICCNIYTVPLSGGTARLLTADTRVGCNSLSEFRCGALMWAPDGKSIVFASNRATLPSLWRVSANGGAVERETTYPTIGSFSKTGRRLVYSEKNSTEVAAIWRADLTAAGGPVLGNRKLISSQYPESDAQPSPEGARIVWMSVRTGSEELWSSSAAGEDLLQLTRLNRYSGTPRWSPDGKWVAFDSYTPSGAQIFVVDSEGRNLHSITTGTYGNAVPSWSRDGKSIYFASKRTGSWQAWKHSLASGAETQLTEHGGFDPFESYDGKTIYFSRFDQAGIWSIPASGGAESPVVADKPQFGYWGYWAISEPGLYFLDLAAEPRPTIEFYRFSTRRTSPVLTLEQRPEREEPSLSATIDGRTLYYTQHDRQNVIKMMEISH
jgi:Tol biopolymer transport system component/DNA-binding winged helix-turn-helix (wHTH) protein